LSSSFDGRYQSSYSTPETVTVYESVRAAAEVAVSLFPCKIMARVLRKPQPIAVAVAVSGELALLTLVDW
jgi:hypothetical protein